uniref:Replication protein n=1 Tax=uncultured prokaryote TaxID=198431 RepID=A0A0H5Q6Q5_9ZZZZ|nr:hypothetical protein [uncultured prokaryote]
MPVAKFYTNGLTMGAGGNPNPTGGKRGNVVGWTQAAVRRHTRWLYSVDSAALTGFGWAVTLTMRDIPATSAEFVALRRVYLQSLRDSGLLLRAHWIVEWTLRKRPHLHLAVYLDHSLSEVEARRILVEPWVRIAAQYGVSRNAQHIGRITGALGWLEYLSKHASRGVAHYQRNGKPAGWDTTGRLWGKIGDWPEVEPLEANLTRVEFFRFRRLVRSWRVADARKIVALGQPNSARISSARRMLKCSDRTLSQVRGVSEWISEDVGMALLAIASRDETTGERAERATPAASGSSHGAMV